MSDYRRDCANENIERAIESAIDSAMTPQDFIQAAWQIWTIVLDERQKQADHVFRDALQK